MPGELCVRLFAEESKGAAGFQDALLDFGQIRKALFACGSLQLRHGDQFIFQVFGVDFTGFDEDIGASFDKLVEFLVFVEEANDEIVGGQKRDSAEDAAGHRIVLADNGVLHGVGEGQQNDQVEGVQLNQLAFAGKTQHDHQEEVNDHRAKDFLRDREG